MMKISSMEFTKYFIFSLLASFSSATSVIDFCVADLNYPVTPAGYPCRNPENLTAGDFVYSGLGVGGNISNVFGFALTPAFDRSFPAMNGLDLAMSRLDFAVGGVVPVHSHRASEVILVIEGTLIAGFIGSDNTAYYKTLSRGDIMIFPESLLHFQVNIGNSSALAFVTLNSANPSLQTTTTSLAANDLPVELLQNITLLYAEQVRMLKATFGGTI